MQYLLLIYENEQRFSKGYDESEMSEYEVSATSSSKISRAAMRCRRPAQRRLCACATASRRTPMAHSLKPKKCWAPTTLPG